jgi:hypothetical protein
MSSQEEAFPAIGDADESLKLLNADSRASVIKRLLSRLAEGELRVTLPGGAALNFSGGRSGLSATIALKRWRALRRVLFGGDIGFAEGYIDGDWATNDLVSLIRLALCNIDALDAAMRESAVFRLTNRLRHWTRPNSRGGSRANIISQDRAARPGGDVLDAAPRVGCAAVRGAHDAHAAGLVRGL